MFANSNFSNAFFQFGAWGPKDSQLIFAYQNNLYYKDSANSETVRITVSGSPGVIFNGHADWLYEEEILNSNRALWFSPYGTDLAYLQINSSLVNVQSWNRYGEYYNLSSNQYPSIESIRYPKPGTPNPEVSLYIVDLHRYVEHIRIRHILPPKHIAAQDFYITKVAWYDNDHLLVAWTVRNQTESTLVICERANNWACEELYRLRADRGWVDGFESGLLGARDKNSVLVRIGKWINQERSEFFHIARIDRNVSSLPYPWVPLVFP